MNWKNPTIGTANILGLLVSSGFGNARWALASAYSMYCLYVRYTCLGPVYDGSRTNMSMPSLPVPDPSSMSEPFSMRPTLVLSLNIGVKPQNVSSSPGVTSSHPSGYFCLEILISL